MEMERKIMKNKQRRKKIVVFGSRTFTDFERLSKELDNYPRFILLCGGANGVDTLAEKYALEKQYLIKYFRPKYDKLGKGAPLIRNIEMAREADEGVCFWDGISPGTKHMLKQLVKYNVPYTIHRF